MSDTYSTLEVEAALCVWEAINERTSNDNDARHATLNAFRDGYGTVHLRHLSMKIGRWCLAVYDAGNAADPHGNAWDSVTYDWEFIPACLDRVAWPSDPHASDEPTLPDPVVTAKLVAASVRRIGEAANA